MKFADVQERARACKAILGCAGLGGLWQVPSGPSARARALLANQGASAGLAPSELLILRVAFDVWDGTGRATVGELLEHLDEVRLAAVAAFVTAYAQPRHERMTAFIADAERRARR